MNNSGGAAQSPWSQPSPRKEQAEQIAGLDQKARGVRLEIGHGKAGHVDDEVVVTLMLRSWRDRTPDADTFAADVLRRIAMQVKAHVRKNPGWSLLGGGAASTIDDFCADTVLAILESKATPCHAEVAFGDFVYRRCLDAAGKLYAKKHSAGQSFDDAGLVEADALRSDAVDSPAPGKSPEEELEEFEAYFAEQQQLERIRQIVQKHLPEKPQIAFTFRYYGNMKIESKDSKAFTVSRLIGCTEKTASKYIQEAIKIILERLKS
jgi:hypothetical protein